MDLKKNAAAALGLELGSTNIKMVLVNEACETLASTSYGWENQLENGIWTYDLATVWLGIEDAFHSLTADVQSRYHVELKTIGSIGVSAMMHGYLPFDKDGKQLAPFRTWRNNITGEAADQLTELFGFNIPQRWSIAHLYQAILNKEDHVKDIAFLTTLAGYVHWQLSGEKVLGIGDASGMFPIDEKTGLYDAAMLEKFESLDAVKAYPWKSCRSRCVQATPAASSRRRVHGCSTRRASCSRARSWRRLRAMPARAWSRRTPSASARATSRSARRRSR